MALLLEAPPKPVILKTNELRSDARLIVFGTICWLLLLLYFRAIHFDWLVSDPRDQYWSKSTQLLDLRNDFTLLFSVQHRDQVPAYTYLITAIRAVLGSDWPPVMQWICYFAWAASLVVVRRIFRALGLAPDLAMLGAAAFGLFPFTGLTYAVYPLSDHLALLSVTAAFLAYLLGRPGLMAAALAVAVLTHKFMWPVAGLFLTVSIITRRVPIWTALVTFAPLAAYWVGVSIVHSDPAYLIAGNVDYGVTARRNYPIADGILASLTASPKEAAKACIALGIATVSTMLSFSRVVRRNPVLFAFAVPLVVFSFITNRQLLWGLCRFGPLMVVPLFAWLSTWTRGRFRGVILTGIVLSLATQFVFASYLKSFFSTH